MSKLHLHARLGRLIIYLISALIVPTALAEDFSVELLPLTTEESPVDASFTAEVIPFESPALSAKRVLIYHTHTYEAYEQSTTKPYQQTEKWRTTDSAHNTIAVGKALAASLYVLMKTK